MSQFSNRDGGDSLWDSFVPRFVEPLFGGPAQGPAPCPTPTVANPAAAGELFGHYAETGRGVGVGRPPPVRGPGRGRLSQEELHEMLEDSPAPAPQSAAPKPAGPAPAPKRPATIGTGKGKFTQEELRDLLE